MKVVIVAKTRMGSGACVGALTFDGRSLRLIAADRDTNEQFNMEYQVGEVWEIETQPAPQIIPPHIENIIVIRKRRLGLMSGMLAFIEQNMPPLPGGVGKIFDGLAQNTKEGSLYIAQRTGLPKRSTMFWIPDKTLRRVEDLKRIRYRYPGKNGPSNPGPTLTYTGFQDAIPEIPAGTVVRVSLAHWWRPPEMKDGEYRCYVQISGWFPLETSSFPHQEALQGVGKKTYGEEIQKIESILQEIFGYQEFRPLQEEIISNVLRKQDSLAVMPTGSGKSLCFQLPATIFPGLTVVVSPLIALMEDQVLELQELGIPAAYLNSTLSHDEYVETANRIRTCEVNLLYAAPETLLKPETTVLLEACQVDCLVIDEAHCISEWGHDFRPEYRQLAELRERIPEAVTLAVTATATPRVRQDIKRSLKILDANEFVSSFDRENLVLTVTDKISPAARVRDFLDAHRGQAGIIYCATREQVDNLTAALVSGGYPALPYHAGMEDEQRRAHQRRFRYEEGIIMVATIAFGMGINKSNLRFILHYNLPKNLESYYQQIGRAGRDGLSADCLLLFSFSDVHTIRHFISQKPPELRKDAQKRLHAILRYVDSRTCRRIPLLAYFGEKYSGDNCGACDRCLQAEAENIPVSDQTPGKEVGKKPTKVDLSDPARMFIACAMETGEFFGAEHLINVLRGSKAKKVLGFKHDELPSHGCGRDYSKEEWQCLAAQFISKGLLNRTQPHGSLKITAKGSAALQGEQVWGTVPGRVTRTAGRDLPPHDRELFSNLRTLRARLAQERKIPPYIIFTDRSLMEMAVYYPQTPLELGKIYGVGVRKLDEYGSHFLKVIRSYCKENGIQAKEKKSQLLESGVRPSGKNVQSIFGNTFRQAN